MTFSAVNVLSRVMIRLASSKSEARRLAMSNAPMGALLAERGLVQKFKVAPIVREQRPLVLSGKV